MERIDYYKIKINEPNIKNKPRLVSIFVSEGLRTIVGYNDKHGLMDMDYNLVVDYKYDYIQTFFNKLAAVKENEKWGFINSNGDVVIPLIYDFVKPFSNEHAKVLKKGCWYLIDKNNNIVKKYNKSISIKAKATKILDNLNVMTLWKNTLPNKYQTVEELPKLKNVELICYCSAFYTFDKIIFIEDSNFELYFKKLTEIEKLIKEEELSYFYESIMDSNYTKVLKR